MKARFNNNKSPNSDPAHHGSTSQNETDYQVWKRFKKGDESAFIIIYKHNVRRLFQLGVKFTKDRNLVKDCLQDFFAELLQKRQNLSDTDNIYLYLFVSFRRKILTYIRKNKKHGYGELKDVSSFPIELGVEQKIINAQWDEIQLEKLNKALQELEQNEREIIYYFYFNNMSYQEIAEILSYKQVSSARRLLYRALNKIRKHFLTAILGILAFGSWEFY